MKFFITSLKHAMRGLRYVFLHERNFRIHVFLALCVVVLMYALSISYYEKVVIWLLIILVLVLELLNSAFEKMLDIIKPRLHQGVGMVKDIVAAGVLLTALCAFVCGCVIFYPYIIELFIG